MTICNKHPTIWLTSDTHFSHTNIIKYCSRPFETVHAMNKHMTDVWNDLVREEDLVIHLGDFSMGSTESAKSVASILKGRKVLIRGNHDSKKVVNALRSLGWLVLSSLSVDDCLFVHKPPSTHEGQVVHGHTHGTWSKEGYTDAGVDATCRRVGHYGPVLASTVVSCELLYSMHRVLLHG